MEGILTYGTHAFLLHFWVESREVAGLAPRVPARVEHLRSGHARAVADAGELLAFINECLDAAGVPARDGWAAP